MSGRDGADAPYWDALDRGHLSLPRCTGCSRWAWPAAHRCGVCGTVGNEWVELPLRATVFSWTRTWHRFGMTEAFDLPFISVVAEVEDCGVRLLGRFDDPGEENPRIGDPLVGHIGETVVGERTIPTIIWGRGA